MSIVCFDLDKTITTKVDGWSTNDYLKAEPNHRTIRLMRRCKENGHKVIIYTSRHSHEDRVVTANWLAMYGVPYDAINFDKPFYDFVVDDKMKDIEELEELI